MIQHARGWIEASLPVESDAVAALASASARVRVLLRCETSARPQVALPPPSDDALVIAHNAQWFRLPFGPQVGLEKRRPLARMLARLACERTEHPGQPLSWAELMEAGWPGEKMIAETGAHRVRVGLSTLRKLGLRELLETTEDGYRLSPQHPAVVLGD